MRTFQVPWRPLLITAGVLSGTAALPQYVQVPAGCTVLVAGGGGGSIALNRVGPGGVVRMPDGFDVVGAGGDFMLNGAAPIGWQLFGDLSTQVAFNQAGPVPGANAPVQTAGAVTMVNIQSYNKNLRVSELATPAVGRSKGRVTISYTIAPCNAVMSFDIYKQWTTSPPAIVGPSCWPTVITPAPLNLVTFSVDQVSSDNALDAIGSDQYYWKFTNGLGANLFAATSGAFYTSADRSSVTVDMLNAAFVAWYTGGPYTLQCCYGRANPWDGGASLSLTQLTAGTTCVTKVIGPAPTAPTFTTPIPSCVNTNVTSFNAAYTAVGGTTYTWTCSNPSWTLTAGVGTLAVTTMDANPGTLTLTVVGPCGSNVYTYAVNRKFVPGLIATTSYCVSPGTLTLSLPANAQNNSTCWTGVPWAVSYGNATHSIATFTIPAAAAGQAFTINATSCPGCVANIPITVTVKPTTPVITGPTCVPSGGGAVQNYTSTTPVGVCATCFTWSNTLGMTGASTSNTIGYTPAGTANGVVQVIAMGPNSCPSLPGTLAVSRNPVAPVITQPLCYNVGVPGTATLTSNTAGTVWSFPGALTASTPGAGTTATINTIGTPGTYACTATVTNACGSAVNNFNVVLSTAAYPVFYTNTGTGAGTTGYLFTNPGPGGTTYQVFNCATSTLLGSPGASSSITLPTPIALNSGSLAMNIVLPAASGGCTLRPPCVVTSHTLLPLAPNGQGPDLNGGHDLRVSPNPNDGIFNLEITRDVVEGKVTIVDAQGRQVGPTTRVAKGTNALSYEGLAPGTYNLRIELDGKVETQGVMVTER